MTATFWGQWRSRRGARQALGSGPPMTPFPGHGTPIPTVMSLDPQSDALTERSRNYYAHAQAGKPRPGRRRRACPCVQRAAAGPEPERGPRFAGPGRWFEKPQRWVSGGRQTYLVSARDLGTSHTLPRSREAHLTSFGRRLDHSTSLTRRESGAWRDFRCDSPS